MDEPGAQIATTRGARIRALFDAVCDLPGAERETRLAELTADVTLRGEVINLVRAQTEAFEKALGPLHALAAGFDAEELQVGDRLGHWTLTRRLGQGGMGSVFVAERDDGLFRQRVALKILRRPSDASAAAHLDAERALLAGLVHPGIARLYDGGSTPQGQPFLVMEHVDGLPLDQWMRTSRPGLAARLALFERLCDAVAHAHRQLVVHCDLKPANVLVRADGQPVLLDFGIARWIGSDGDHGTTRGAESAGGYCTPAYASPEQLRKENPGVATDVFALGILLAELLADAPMRRSPADAGRPATPPSRFAAGTALAWKKQLPGNLDAIIAKATAPDAHQRYPDVAALAEDLARHREHRPLRARPASRWERVVLFLRRYRRGSAVAVGMALLVAGFTTQLVIERDRARQAAETAEQVSRFMIGAFDAANVRRNAAQRDPLASDVLAAGAARVERELAAQPAVQARLLLAIGSAYQSLGQPGEADRLLSRSIDLALAVGDSEAAIDALQQRSVIAGNDSRGEEALALATQADALRRAEGDDSTFGRAESLNHLGLALTALRRFDDARKALSESLRLRRELGPEAVPKVLVTLNNLARVERLDDRPAAAATGYREAIALARPLGAAGEFSLETSLNGLGRALTALGRQREALPVLHEGYALALRLFGADSAHTAEARTDLAMAYWDLGDLAQAELLLRTSLATARRIHEPDTLSIAVAMNNLGQLLGERGDLGAALPLLEGSLAIRRQRLAADDPALRRGAYALARFELAGGDAAAAQARIAGYLAEQLAHPEPQRPEWWRQVLLGLEAAWQKGEPAQLVREQLSTWPLPTDPALALPRWRAERLHALLLAAEGRHAAARRSIDAAVATASSAESPVDAARLRVDAARLALAAGERDAARRHLEAAQPVLASALLPQAPERREADRLASALQARGARRSEAEM